MSNTALQSFPRRRHAHTALDRRTLAEQRKAEEAAREKALYGNALPDAQLLRRVGYVVNAEKGKFRVGNKLLDKAGLVAMAERERRLIGGATSAPATTANGQKIGHVERLTPKKAPRRTLPAPRRPVLAKSSQSKPKPAKAPEHSTELGTKPRVVWLDLGLLKVDRTYQREINDAGRTHIARITKAFNWNCYQPVIVTEQKNGTYAVIDGQHRLEAAKRHPLIKELPCYIIHAPDIAAQAAVFVAVNTQRKALTGIQKFWAAHAGGDPHAVALAKCCAEAGVTIPRAPPSGGLAAKLLLGPNVIEKHVAKVGIGPVREAVRLLAEAWPAHRTAFRTSNVAALVRVAMSPGYSREAVLRTMRRLDPDQLFVEALKLSGSSKTSDLGRAVEQILRKAA